MELPPEGGCACGAIRYRLGSDPLFVHCCLRLKAAFAPAASRS